MSRHTFSWFPVLDTDDLVFNSVIQPSGVARPGQFPLFLGCFLSLQVFQDCPEAPTTSQNSCYPQFTLSK